MVRPGLHEPGKPGDRPLRLRPPGDPPRRDRDHRVEPGGPATGHGSGRLQDPDQAGGAAVGGRWSSAGQDCEQAPELVQVTVPCSNVAVRPPPETRETSEVGNPRGPSAPPWAT